MNDNVLYMFRDTNIFKSMQMDFSAGLKKISFIMHDGHCCFV